MAVKDQPSVIVAAQTGFLSSVVGVWMVQFNLLILLQSRGA
jgi:hypothetical protein